MSNWKKYAAAALAAFVAANGVMGWLSPDLVLTLVGIAAGIGIVIPSGKPADPVPTEPNNPFGLRSPD